jgi:hypothetical protein
MLFVLYVRLLSILNILFIFYLIAVAYDRGDPVLVYSDRGVSRSAAVIVAFISFQMRMNSQVSVDKLIQKIVHIFSSEYLASFEIC